MQATTFLDRHSVWENVGDCHEVILCVEVSTLFEISLCGGDDKCSSLVTNRVYQLNLSGPSNGVACNVKGVDWHTRHASVIPIGTGLRASIEVDSPGEWKSKQP